jgi:glycosyltransferase involved in cell wall biosynthesis
VPKERIALFLPSLEGGGAEKVFALIANWLASQGHDVHMLLGVARGVWLSRLDPAVKVKDLGCPSMRGAPSSLRRYLRSARPRAVFSALTHANLALIIATRLFDRFPGRVVVQETQPLERSRVLAWGQKERLFMSLAKLLYPRADAVTAVSASVAQSLGRVASQVLANPMDLGSLEASAVKPPDHPWFQEEAPPVVMGMGRLSREKGFDILIQAIALAREQRELRLVILGEGPERPHLQKLVSELGLEHAVDLPGFLENPYAYLSRAGLFVLSSLGEGFSLALAEAMACGCNVVTTNCGQEPLNMVDHGRFGSVAPVGDAQALAQAILERLKNPLPAEKLTARVSPYALDQIGPKYQELLLPGQGQNASDG